MENSFCRTRLENHTSTVSDGFRSSVIANCVLNAFLSYTTIMLNSVTIHAIRKTLTLPKPLKTLLLSLAVSDLGVGLMVQPFWVVLWAVWLEVNIPSCSVYDAFTIILAVFSIATLFSVMAVTVDRFLAIHLHLRYQELVTHKRVVAVAFLIWVLSAFLSLLALWIPWDNSFVVFGILDVICLVTTSLLYCKIYLAVRRHRNQIQNLHVHEVARNNATTNFARLKKSAIGTFYVYLVFLSCYLPQIFSYAAVTIVGFNAATKHLLLHTPTLVFLNSCLNPLIYCWKMRHIRNAITDILRNIFT